ncbi:MAG: sulfotransferase [Actinomycetota bacterium]
MNRTGSSRELGLTLRTLRPTFLLIGAQRSGTTWLATLLARHPEVSVPSRKELHHFDLVANRDRGWEHYATHFADCVGRAVGEATPNYLGVHGPAAFRDRLAAAGVDVADHPEVVRDPSEDIGDLLPDLRLLVLLRDPVARAISSWRHQIRMGELSPRAPFRAVCGRHGIVTMGAYHAHLDRWRERFPADRFLVGIFEEDVATEPDAFLRRVYGHIGVDPDFEPSGTADRPNERASDLELHLRAIRPGLHDRLRRVAPFIRRIDWPSIAPTQDDLAMLADLYRPDVAELEGLLDRPLDIWTRRWE